jgi:hypothetical protein
MGFSRKMKHANRPRVARVAPKERISEARDALFICIDPYLISEVLFIICKRIPVARSWRLL